LAIGLDHDRDGQKNFWAMLRPGDRRTFSPAPFAQTAGPDGPDSDLACADFSARRLPSPSYEQYLKRPGLPVTINNGSNGKHVTLDGTTVHYARPTDLLG
jgi:hypothetical protein